MGRPPRAFTLDASLFRIWSLYVRAHEAIPAVNGLLNP